VIIIFPRVINGFGVYIAAVGLQMQFLTLVDFFGKEIDPYRFNPDPTTKYMELSLSDSAINAMHRTGVPLRSIPASDGKR